MKIKDSFLMKSVAGKIIVVPVGSATLDFNAVVTLNDTGSFLFSLLQSKDCTEGDLVDALTAEYEVDRETAERDVARFVEKISEAGMME
ncbi:MAG: PqqD family protein [Clostridia bacterium]|nr:PqqD family protein [Clostridia bacterium]MBR3593233.1 PqqD family protein [Clostridia bacterium]